MSEKPQQPQPGFGRVAIPDARDFAYAPKAVGLFEISNAKFQYWNPIPVLDQGTSSHCVGYSCYTLMRYGPTPLKQLADPATIYRWAQQNDFWPGEEPTYYGTSVRAGLDFLRHNGLIHSYHRMTSFDELEAWLLDRGPIVVGTDWRRFMDRVDPKTNRVPDTGDETYRGGHAYLYAGINRPRGTVTIQNSWGNRYGRKGRALMSYDLVQRLVFEDNGDAYGVIKV